MNYYYIDLKHPEEDDLHEKKAAVAINQTEIPDEWTDKSIDLNKYPDEDNLHEKKMQVTINPTKNPDEWTEKEHRSQ